MRKILASILSLTILLSTAWSAPATPGGSSYNGVEVACDLPELLRVKNTVGTDGQGLCVWASTEMAARYQNCEEMVGVFEQMKRERGGGWPDRVDSVMKSRAPGVKYQQYLGPDIAFIQTGIDSGRPVCVTYGYGELYGMKTIAHMVLCVYMDATTTGIIDNNDPGRIWWMDTSEFKRRFGWPRGSGWAWYTFAPPPPPAPRH